MNERDSRRRGWSLLTIATHTDRGDGHAMPRWTGGSDVELTRVDGRVDEFVAKEVDVNQQSAGGVDALKDVSARILLTDARVVIVVRRFLAKGGGWWGTGAGAFFAIVANVVSKARAATQGSGKAVVGHVRYEWLRRVGHQREKGIVLHKERLRLEFCERGEAEPGFVEFALPRDVSAALVAQEIVRRAARHRLSTLAADDAESAGRCRQLTALPLPPDSADRFAWVEIPVAHAPPVKGGAHR